MFFCIFCTDSDDDESLRIFKKGITANATSSYTDYCINESELVEYACNGDEPDMYIHTFSCPGYGTGIVCENGACVSKPVVCTASDSSGDLAIKGTVANSSGSYTDYCEGNILYQYSCVGGKVNRISFNCAGGTYGPLATCTNGACTSNTNPASSSGGGGGGGGGSSSGASTSTTPSTTYSSPSVSSGGSGNNVPSTISEKGGVVSQSKFDINPQESTITGSDGVIARSSIQVSTDEGKAYATKGDGSKQEIKIDPTTAINSVKESTNSNSTEEVKIVEYENKVVYEIEVTKLVKIVALVPAKMSIQTKVDIENGDIVNIKKPWWSFLAKEG